MWMWFIAYRQQIQVLLLWCLRWRMPDMCPGAGGDLAEISASAKSAASAPRYVRWVL